MMYYTNWINSTHIIKVLGELYKSGETGKAKIPNIMAVTALK